MKNLLLLTLALSFSVSALAIDEQVAYQAALKVAAEINSRGAQNVNAEVVAISNDDSNPCLPYGMYNAVIVTQNVSEGKKLITRKILQTIVIAEDGHRVDRCNP